MHPDPQGGSAYERALRIAVLAVACGFGVAQLVFALTDWSLVDMDAYWDAAMRLRASEPLYPALRDSTTADVYRYAPWFATAWIPLSFLPKGVVSVAWSAALISATAWIVRKVVLPLSAPAIALAALAGGLLVLIDKTGNVHALVVATLLFGVERRSGPLWIALAASLKVVPILYVLVYAGRGEWRRVAYTIAATVALVAPMLWCDLSSYPTDPGELSYSLFNRAFPLWTTTILATAGLSLALAARRSAHPWLASSLAAIAALPRLWTYDFTFVVVGLARRPGGDR